MEQNGVTNELSEKMMMLEQTYNTHRVVMNLLFKNLMCKKVPDVSRLQIKNYIIKILEPNKNQMNHIPNEQSRTAFVLLGPNSLRTNFYVYI